ncbi:MAG: PAS domain S-box protein [Magnetovibrio sp.]|nr:PAS domain S-box protein [Magnetovibrio sp.]
MTKRYAFALTAIALLACSAFAALELVIVQQESTGAVVNISGRQRMLSQRTTLFVQRLLLAKDATEYQQFKGELLKAVDLIEKSHKGLTQGDEELGLPDVMSETVHRMYFEGEMPLDEHMKSFVSALRTVLATEFGSLSPDLPEIDYILSTAPTTLLKSLDKMVWQYQHEGEEVIEVLHRLEAGVLILTLLTLMLEALFIFRPMVKQVGINIRHLSEISEKLSREITERMRAEDRLREARDKLEERVEERTIELTREISQREMVEFSLRESEQRFRSVTETANDAIISVDEDGNIITWNRGAKLIFGYEEHEALGNAVEILMPEEYRAPHKEGINRLNTGGEPHIKNQIREFQGIHKSGQIFPLELSISTWNLEGKHFYTGIIRDITKRKKNEASLHKAKEQAETATKAKSEFLANMSHELRTPLNSIIGFSEMMHFGIKGPLNDNYTEYAELIMTSGRLLLETVNSILDLAKIEAGKLDLEIAPVFMGDIVDEVITLLQVQANNKSVKLLNNTNELHHLNVDQIRMKQTLINTIGNAIKFTEKGSVTVSNHCDAQGHRIIISDTGIGMTPKQVEEAMKPFGQVHGNSLARRFQGTGLGLSISHEIMKLHGGNLSVESSEGQGTSVILFFPPDAGINYPQSINKITVPG